MANKASLLKISKVASTKVEMAKIIIKVYILLSDIHLSESCIVLLAYFMVYGVSKNTKELVIKSSIAKNDNVIRGLMTKLRQNGLIYKDELNLKTYVCSSLSFNLTPTTGIYIKLNNKADEH